MTAKQRCSRKGNPSARRNKRARNKILTCCTGDTGHKQTDRALGPAPDEQGDLGQDPQPFPTRSPRSSKSIHKNPISFGFGILSAPSLAVVF